MKHIAYLFVLTAFIFSTNLTASEVDSIISKARAHVGSESTISSLESIELKGRITSSANVQGSVHLIFKGPKSQFQKTEFPGQTEIKATNGVEGWTKINDNLGVMPADSARTLIINTQENLNYLHAYKSHRYSTVTDEGSAKIMGKSARKIVFKFKKGPTIERYFNPSSNDLIATRSTENDLIIVEEQHATVKGLRLPKVIKAYDSNENLVYTINLSELKVNEYVDDSIFKFPSLF